MSDAQSAAAMITDFIQSQRLNPAEVLRHVQQNCMKLVQAEIGTLNGKVSEAKGMFEELKKL